MQQEFHGRDGDTLRVSTFVRGTLPEVAANAAISFTDYDEKLTREAEAGFIRSYGDRHLVVRVGEQEVLSLAPINTTPPSNCIFRFNIV